MYSYGFETRQIRHFKGKEYRLIGIATHSETLEPLVVYQCLYAAGGLWVCPAHMWSEQIETEHYLEYHKHYAFNDNRHFIRYVYYINRDALFEDLFEKLGE